MERARSLVASFATHGRFSGVALVRRESETLLEVAYGEVEHDVTAQHA